MEELINKELQREVINKTIKDATSSSENIIITFEDGSTMEFYSYHEQDCCENVYADFKAFDVYKDDLIKKTVKEIIIKGVKDIGFMICFYFDWESSVKVFVPCYNCQNGYYSSNLDLIIETNNVKKTISLDGFVEDYIH